MNSTTLLHLLDKFKKGCCTAEEQLLLYRWLDRMEQEAPEQVLLSAAEKEQLKNVMLQNILHAAAPAPHKRVPHLRWLQVAAAVLVFAGISWLLQRLVTTPNAGGWLTQQNNSSQVQPLLLPDGSRVVLGAHSSLQYSRNGRTIQLLRGKAFFNVAASPRHPFTVESNGIHTTVLGTSFSVASYPQLYGCRITVATGKVQVQHYGILKAAQRITIPAATAAPPVRDSVAVSDALAWTSGTIMLRNASLQELLFMLQEQYGITVRTQLNTLQGSYTIRLHAAMPLQQVLDVIEKISYKPKIHFRMQEHLLTVY